MRRRRAALALMLAIPLLAAAPARAQTAADIGRIGAATMDILILRPLGLAASVAGLCLFVPAAIVTTPNGMEGIEEAWEQFVVVPGEHTFTRPLGDI